MSKASTETKSATPSAVPGISDKATRSGGAEVLDTLVKLDDPRLHLLVHHAGLDEYQQTDRRKAARVFAPHRIQFKSGGVGFVVLDLRPEDVRRNPRASLIVNVNDASALVEDALQPVGTKYTKDVDIPYFPKSKDDALKRGFVAFILGEQFAPRWTDLGELLKKCETGEDVWRMFENRRKPEPAYMAALRKLAHDVIEEETSPRHVATLQQVLEDAGRAEPTTNDDKDKFVKLVNRILEETSHRILLPDGRLARLCLNLTGASNKGYIQFRPTEGGSVGGIGTTLGVQVVPFTHGKHTKS